MYWKCKTSKEIELENHVVVQPVASLTDGYGMCQIYVDDHCYVLALRQESGLYKPTHYIFPEAFEVLRKLSNPIND